MNYDAGYLPGRNDGFRAHLSVRWGADPAKPVWSCPHQHKTAEEAVECAKAQRQAWS